MNYPIPLNLKQIQTISPIQLVETCLKLRRIFQVRFRLDQIFVATQSFEKTKEKSVKRMK